MIVFKKLKTAYRRINHPIRNTDLVIDIGSGGIPNPRANIAIDFMDDDFERDTALKIDRPFFWANVEHLPFKNRAFDFSIFSHVLEHLHNPDIALKEIERISKSGYIETPNSFYEVAYPHDYHLSRCSIVRNELHIHFKKEIYESLGEDFEDVNIEIKRMFHEISYYDPRILLTKFYWKDNISFKIFGTPPTFTKNSEDIKLQKKSFTRRFLTNLVYVLWKPRKTIKLDEILACPLCHSELDISENEACCKNSNCCNKYYKHKGYFDFRITKTKR